MRKPRESVADNETKWKIKPVSGANDPDKQNDSKRRADKMKIMRQRLGMFFYVKIPEFRIIFDLFQSKSFIFQDLSNRNKEHFVWR